MTTNMKLLRNWVAVTQIHRLLQEHGSRVLLCGGATRDFLMGEKPLDMDLVAFGSVEFLMNLFGKENHHPNPSCYGFRIDGGPIMDIRGISSLDKDSTSRDFTMNALYMDPLTGEISDPTGKGLEDLKSGVIRCCDKPEITIGSDPIRALRAERFAARFGFQIVGFNPTDFYHMIDFKSAPVKTEMKKREK